MKDLFQSAWITTWLNRFNVKKVIPTTRKTPWYRKTWMNVPIVPVCLIAPFALFLLWKGRSVWSRSQTES